MKLFNLLLTAAIAFTTLGIASAQQTYTAYSVTNLTIDSSRTGVYVVTVSVSKGSKAPIFINGDVLRISTSGCQGTPVKGDNGIVVNGPQGRSLLTSGGATCKVTSIDLAEKH